MRRSRTAILRSALYSAEALERRVLLAGYFDGIADFVTATTQPGTQPAVPGVMKQITNALRSAGSVANRIPLINKPARDLTQFTDSLESFRTALDAKLRSFTEGAAASFIQGQLFGALNPLGVVGDRNNSGSITSDDIAVAVSGLNVDVVFDVAKSFTFDCQFGLGMDAIPFKPATPQKNGGFTAGFTYRNFNFGIQGGVPYFRTNSADEIEFTLLGNLPATQFTAGLGFLNVSAQDGTPGVTDLNVTLRGDVTPSFGLANFRIDGALNLLLNVEASLNNPGLPRFKTGFKFDWNFPTINLSGGLESGSFGVPSLSFQNVQMNLGSVLSSIVGPIAKRVQYITAPFQPIFDLTKKPIPGLNDLSQAFGGPTVTPLFLSNAFEQLPPAQQTESLKNLSNIIQSAEKLRWFGETVNNLASAAGGEAWLNLGNFNIAGPAGGSLFDAAASAVGDLANVDWSQLQALVNGGTPDFNAIKAQTLSLLGPGLGNEVNAIWSALEGEALGNGLTYEFPIIKDPARVALGMLLGRDSDMVTLTARYTIGLDKVFNLVPVPGVIVGVGAVAQFSAYAKIGYDTRGLREAISPMYGGGSFDPTKLLRGFWIDKDTRADATGRITLALGVGVPGVVTATVEGGLETGLHAAIGNPQNQAKIRPFVPGHLSQYLFTAGGTIQARAFFRFKAGVTILGKHIGVDILKDFANVTLLNFDVGGVDGGNVPIPADLTEASIPPALLASQSGGALTLLVGSLANQRGSANPGATAESYEISRVFSRINFGGSWVDLPTSEIEVRAFGFSQRFSNVTLVTADFGSDADLLTIHDSGITQYDINGGDGADKLVMDGAANVTLRGGNGNDTLDGGMGRDFIYLYGDAGFDKLTFARGRLDLLSLNTDFVFLFGGADGGEVAIDNSAQPDPYNPLRPRWTYYFTPPSGATPWVLTAGPTGSSNASDYKFIRFNDLNVALTAGAGDDTFSGAAPPNATLFGGDGDDDYFLANTNTPTQLSSTNYAFNYYPGAGFDRLLVYNNGSASASQPITLDNGAVELGSGANVGRMNLGMGDLEQSFIQQGPNSPVNVAGWTDKPVTVIGGSQLVLATGWVGWNAQITAVNVGGFVVNDGQDFSPYNRVGVDEVGLYRQGDIEKVPDPANPGQFIDGTNRVRMYLVYSANTSSVTLNGRNTPNFLDVSLALADIGRPFTVNYNGKANAGNQLWIVDPTSAGRTYVLDTATQFVLGQLTVNTQNLDTMNLQAGGGNDTFFVTRVRAGSVSFINGGNGDDAAFIGNVAQPISAVLGGGVFFDGQAGVDSIEVDDRSNASNGVAYDFANYWASPSTGGGAGVDPRATESRLFRGALNRSGNYTLGNGNGGWTIEGGNLDDEFNIFGQFAYFNEDGSDGTSINGGFGNDRLQLRNDEELGHSPTTIRDNQVDFGTGGHFDYVGIDDLRWFTTLTPTVKTSVINFLSAPAGAPVGFYGRPGTAEVLNFGSPAQSATWAGPLTIDLQQGPFPLNDRFNLFTPDLAAPSQWRIQSNAILRNGAPYVSFAGAKEVGLYAGPGDDVVDIVNTNNLLAKASVSTDGGTNVVNVGDGLADLTGIAGELNVDGSGGTTTLYYNGQATTGVDESIRLGGGLLTHSARAPFVGSVLVTRSIATLLYTGLTELRVRTSPLLTTVQVPGTVATREALTLIESAGDDHLTVGAGYGQGIQAPIIFLGSGNDDHVTVDAAYTDNATTHFRTDALNAMPGDDLLGAYFVASGYDSFHVLAGRNARVFATPSYFGPVSFTATTGVGVSNELRVAHADAPGATHQPSLVVPLSGTWTFDAPYEGIAYAGFDVVAGDAVRPTLLQSQSYYDFDALAPRVSATFSEEMIGGLYTPGISIENLTTSTTINPALLDFNTTDPTRLVVRYKPDGATVGALPDGRYRLTVNADSYADSAGNRGAADATLDFFVLAADANRDARVNFDDLLILAANYNQSGRSFSQGDFTYDGVVNFDDLLVLASRYNQTLPISRLRSPTGVPPVKGNGPFNADQGGEGTLSAEILQ